MRIPTTNAAGSESPCELRVHSEPLRRFSVAGALRHSLALAAAVNKLAEWKQARYSRGRHRGCRHRAVRAQKLIRFVGDGFAVKIRSTIGNKCRVDTFSVQRDAYPTTTEAEFVLITLDTAAPHLRYNPFR